jgi:hypothetical protein
LHDAIVVEGGDDRVSSAFLLDQPLVFLSFFGECSVS